MMNGTGRVQPSLARRLPLPRDRDRGESPTLSERGGSCKRVRGALVALGS